MEKCHHNELAFAKKVFKEVDYELILLYEQVMEQDLPYGDICERLASVRETLAQFNFGP